MAVGDVNGDGKPDLVVANDSSNTVSVLLGNGDGTFQAPADLRHRVQSDFVAVGRRQRRRQARPRRRQCNGSNTVSVLLGNGNGTFQAQQTFATGANPRFRGGGGRQRRRQARPRRRQ